MKETWGKAKNSLNKLLLISLTWDPQACPVTPNRVCPSYGIT